MQRKVLVEAKTTAQTFSQEVFLEGKTTVTKKDARVHVCVHAFRGCIFQDGAELFMLIRRRAPIDRETVDTGKRKEIDREGPSEERQERSRAGGISFRDGKDRHFH